MSRVGKNPVAILDGVTVAVSDGVLTAKGKLGEQKVRLSPLVKVSVGEKEVTVAASDLENTQSRIMWGTIRSLVNNAVHGVAKGFEKSLELKGVGYKVLLKGSILDLTLGFSHNIEYRLPDGVKAEIVSPTEIRLVSADKELLGKTAAEIRAFRPPEPYKGKGVKYKDEYVRRKEGKKK
ncbi:MAG: 50S ribosomal protein L6 [Rickettsiales bacterium]|jgi:large subunit ribosomal protein L6|nr:50S ribosomal protein L6 [Rickettsiales bacterium]